jgi:hypothetical protein
LGANLSQRKREALGRRGKKGAQHTTSRGWRTATAKNRTQTEGEEGSELDRTRECGEGDDDGKRG